MAVMEEQNRQKNDFFDANPSGKFVLDQKKLASTYRLYSKEALRQAHSRAVRHAKHLQAVLGLIYARKLKFELKHG